MKFPTRGEVMADITIEIEVTPKKDALWGLKCAIAKALFNIAAWVLGAGGIELRAV
jgi:hypothetical protein